MEDIEKAVLVTFLFVVVLTIGMMVGATVAERAAHNSGYNECLLKHVVKGNEK